MKPAMNLPKDFQDFIQSRQELDYEPTLCEAGRVTLVPYSQLELQLFPVDCQDSEVSGDDPHKGELGSYLVTAVNLTQTAEKYDGEGLLLWLPKEKQFGTWDCSHPFIMVFEVEASWSMIIQDPVKYLNAQWSDGFLDSAEVTPLKPWIHHKYSKEQVHTSLPLKRSS